MSRNALLFVALSATSILSHAETPQEAAKYYAQSAFSGGTLRGANAACLPVASPPFASTIIPDSSFIIPDQDSSDFAPGTAEKLKQRATLLEKKDLVSSESATFYGKSGPVKAHRYYPTAEGMKALRQDNYHNLCLQAGKLVADRADEAPGEKVGPGIIGGPKPLTYHVYPKWVDQPSWLDDTAGKLAFADGIEHVRFEETAGSLQTVYPFANGYVTQADLYHVKTIQHDLTESGPGKDLIEDTELALNRTVVPHAYLSLQLEILSSSPLGKYSTGKLFISDAPSALQNTLRISQTDRELAKSELDALVDAKLLTKSPSSALDASLPPGQVYSANEQSPDLAAIQGYPARISQIDLGPLKLGNKIAFTWSTPGRFLAKIPYTLVSPPSWLDKAAKNHTFYRLLRDQSYVTVRGQIRNGHYEITSTSIDGPKLGPVDINFGL